MLVQYIWSNTTVLIFNTGTCAEVYSCTQLYWYSVQLYTRVFEHNTDNSADFQYTVQLYYR